MFGLEPPCPQVALGLASEFLEKKSKYKNF